jgi:predicted metal-binding membrane protein
MTETAPSVLEAVLRRDRTVVVAALVMVIGLSWLWTPAYAALMFAMWSVMMVAMMLPSAAPVLLIFARISRR